MGAFYILEPTNTCYSQYKGSKLVCLFVGRASVSVLETCVAHWRRLWVAGGHRTREPHPSITSLCPPTEPSLVLHTAEGREDVIQRAGVQFRGHNQATPIHQMLKGSPQSRKCMFNWNLAIRARKGKGCQMGCGSSSVNINHNWGI